MKTYYQPSTSDFAINGVIAISMSDDIRKQLEGKATFLDPKSKEVQAYLSAVADRDAKQLAITQAAEDAADEQAALTELLKELHSAELDKRIKLKKAVRQELRKVK
jgi:hypothetical protein